MPEFSIAAFNDQTFPYPGDVDKYLLAFDCVVARGDDLFPEREDIEKHNAYIVTGDWSHIYACFSWHTRKATPYVEVR